MSSWNFIELNTDVKQIEWIEYMEWNEFYQMNAQGILNPISSHIQVFAVHGYQLFKQIYKLWAVARR